MSDVPPLDRPCPCCEGSGRIALTSLYAATVNLLASQDGEVNGAELARLAGCKETAMNNRLVQLEQFGSVVSRRDGRQRLWKVVGPS